MSSTQVAATELVDYLRKPSLDLTAPERAFLFGCLVQQSKFSQRALAMVLGFYYLAAAGEWAPSLGDLSALIYAPLDNPSLIPDVEP